MSTRWQYLAVLKQYSPGCYICIKSGTIYGTPPSPLLARIHMSRNQGVEVGVTLYYYPDTNLLFLSVILVFVGLEVLVPKGKNASNWSKTMAPLN